MTNMAQIHEFCKKILSFKPEFFNLVIYEGYASWQQIQNFSTISPKLCLQCQKTQGHAVAHGTVHSRNDE